jgi:hypothetical protein
MPDGIEAGAQISFKQYLQTASERRLVGVSTRRERRAQFSGDIACVVIALCLECREALERSFTVHAELGRETKQQIGSYRVRPVGALYEGWRRRDERDAIDLPRRAPGPRERKLRPKRPSHDMATRRRGA